MMFALALALLADPATATPPPPVERCGYRIVETFPHDRSSFTQGLFWHEGHLYEATGQYGQSRVARLDLKTGKALAQSKLPSDQFGEGITRWGDQIIGVTWQGGIGNRWSIRDLKPAGTFKYEGEGWGLTMVGDSFDDAANSVRLDGYALAGVRASMSIGQNLELYGRVDNLFDADYATASGFGTHDRAAYGGVRVSF